MTDISANIERAMDRLATHSPARAYDESATGLPAGIQRLAGMTSEPQVAR